MPARSWFIWPILAAALLATLFASQGVAGQQGEKNSNKRTLDFLKKKQAKINHNPYLNGPGKAKTEINRKKNKKENATTKKQNKSKAKKENLGKIKLKHKKQKNPGKRYKGMRGAPSKRAYTCNGTSLGDTCLTNLLNSLKFEKDKIRTFTNQKKRAESFKKLIGNKGGKDDQFGNTTTYLLMALGGNMTNLNCSGKTSLTTEAAATYTTLSNCSASIAAACAVPNKTANFTLLDTCKTVYSEIQTKNAACLKLTTDGTKACTCWSEAANMTASAKKLSDDCDAKSTQLEMKSLKKTCLASFSACKKAEDSSVAFIMTCSQDSSSSSSSSNVTSSNLNITVTSNSTTSTSNSRERRSLMEDLGLLGGLPDLTSL